MRAGARVSSTLCLLGCVAVLVGPAGAVEDIAAALAQVWEAGLDLYTPTSPALGDALCRVHGKLVRQGVNQGQLWALHMLDASSKLPSGLLAGNLVQLGNVDQCLAVSHTDPEHGEISGQHCLVALGVHNAFSATTLYDQMSAGLNATGLDAVEALLSQARFAEALGHVGATWSLCVPASCSAAEVRLHLHSLLAGRMQVRLDDLACVSRRSSDAETWTAGALVVLTIFAWIIIFVAVGTLYDLLTRQATTPRNQYLLALSLYTNGQHLLKVTSSPDHLASLEGLRCLSTCWVVLAHHFWFALHSPTTNFRQLDAISRHWTLLIVANATLVVDTFFLMSGTLVAFNFFCDRERRVRFQLWRYYLNRYVRLSPTYAVAMLVTATLIRGWSDAPFARVNEAFIAKSCAKYGWFAPFYLSNYLDAEHSCVGQMWSTSSDMQLFWISPLLLFPLWSKPRLGFALLLTTAAASTALSFYEAYQLDLPLENLLHFSATSRYIGTLYVKTQLRATPWLVGLALGCLLHETRSCKPALSRKQIALGWTASALVTSYLFYGAHAYFQAGAQPDRAGAALHNALMRPAWALAGAWLLFACEQGYGGCVNAFLAWRGWQVPGRVCYSLGFTHFLFVSVFSVLKKTPQHYSGFAAMVDFLGLLVMSFCAGVGLHLLVEAPASRLYKLRMREEQTQPKKDS